MHKDEKGNIIGKGELSAIEILIPLFPECEVKTQVPLSTLLEKDWAEDLSERQQKETIDIVIYSNPIIAIRVQDAHHRGRITSMRDVVQRKTLEWNNITVVDLLDTECTELLKERVNDKSKKEVLKALNSCGII